MLKIENTEVLGWEHAIRGMRNPMNSWGKSDSCPAVDCGKCGRIEREGHCKPADHQEECKKYECYEIGPNDLDLMKRLRNAGTDHRKFMRMIVVYVDLTAPLYWWTEFKTYRNGKRYGDEEPDILPIPDDYLEYDIEMNSCSTMHKIAAKEFTLEDFSCEHLIRSPEMGADEVDIRISPMQAMLTTIECLNGYRDLFLKTKDKKYWWQMIQLLPTSYNQRRTVMLNYEVLANMYKSRKGHRLDEWKTMLDWIESLPYSSLITGKGKIHDETMERDRRKS
mgnify:FL=1